MKKSILLHCCVFISFITFGQAGIPDQSFGTKGESLIPTNHKSPGCINDIEQQPDGRS